MVKNSKMYIFYGVSVFLYVGAMVALFQPLPELVPLHIGLNGEFDRMGEKQEILVQFAIPLAISISLFLLSVYYRKKNYTDNERALLILGIIFSCFAIVFNGVYVARILDWIPQNIGMEKIIVWVAGLLLCSFGIVFCTVKTKINSILGVRTRWSIQSEEVWAKSQKSGGRVFIADSVSMLVVGVFLKGSLCMIVAFSIVIISVPIIVFFTHQISIKH